LQQCKGGVAMWCMYACMCAGGTQNAIVIANPTYAHS
jgi:hypothetical protein